MSHEVVERSVYRPLANLVIPLTVAVMVLGGCAEPTAVVPAASPPSTTVIVTSPSTTVQRVYTYPEGRYQLYGDGTVASPYYWVWIPAGVTAPVPPPLPHTPVP